MKDKISVLTTVYNEEQFIASSIKSILNQSYKSFELIVINDFSNDGTHKILKKIKDKRLKIYNLKKRYGRTKALNFGLKKCKFNIIAIQDADDFSFKDRLSVQSNKLKNDKSLGLVASRAKYIDDNGNVIDNSNIYFSKNINNLKFRNFITHSSVMFNRTKISKSFLYDKKYKYAQDYKMIVTFLKLSKIFIFNKKLVKIRINRKRGMTVDKKLSLVIIKESINLLNYSKKNFKNNFKEIFLINFYLVRRYLKLLFLQLKKLYGNIG